MTEQEFIRAAKTALPMGCTFDNPGGGTSQILGVRGNAITYRRRNSNIRVLWTDLYRAFDRSGIGRTGASWQSVLTDAKTSLINQSQSSVDWDFGHVPASGDL